MKPIHCLGVAVVDALSGELASYPAPRVRVQVSTDRVSFLPGGGAVNTSSALARMGFSTAIFSKIGKDLMGSFLLKELEKCGVDTRNVCVSEHDSTPFTFVGIHPKGDRTFIHTPGANKTFSLEDLSVERLLDTDFLLYQDLWVMPELDGRSGAEILSMARRAGAVTLLDECYGLGPKVDVLQSMLPSCDYFLPSMDDVRVLYPDSAPDDLASRFLDCGAGTVVLKMGPDGCLLAKGSDRAHLPALPSSVVDTTGAGDCWNAGFIAGLAMGEGPEMAARIGNACAAFSIESVGGSTGVPGYAAVLARARK